VFPASDPSEAPSAAARGPDDSAQGGSCTGTRAYVRIANRQSVSAIRRAMAVVWVEYGQQVQRGRLLLEQYGATQKGSIIPKLLMNMVGPGGLEPQVSTVSNEPTFHRFLPLLSFSSVSNNFGGSASRSK
jgi:hypothetical protein